MDNAYCPGSVAGPAAAPRPLRCDRGNLGAAMNAQIIPFSCQWPYSERRLTPF